MVGAVILGKDVNNAMYRDMEAEPAGNIAGG